MGLRALAWLGSLAAEPKRVLVGRAGGNVRKRKTRYQWLHITGTQGPGADITDDTAGRDFGGLAVPANGTEVAQIVDLLEDEAPEEQASGLPMGVYENNEYFIKRIVGKFFIATSQVANATAPEAVLVAAGLFIARSEDSNIITDEPIGAFGTTATRDNYSPFHVENNELPWIWQRTWILSNQKSTVGSGQGNETFPSNTAGYGSVMDGGHIDAKTARRVKKGERLFAIVAARQYPLNATSSTNATVRAYIQYRVLGAMRKGHNRSAF